MIRQLSVSRNGQIRSFDRFLLVDRDEGEGADRHDLDRCAQERCFRHASTRMRLILNG
jgi:hypothetical protein